MAENTFAFRNSIFFNGAAAAFATILFAVFQSKNIESGQTRILALVALGFVAVWFFYRTFDRRIKVLINNDGVFVNRGALDEIKWSDVSRFTLSRTRGGPLLILHFKEADAWMKTAKPSGRLISKFFNVKDFFTQIPLETMPYDEAKLRAFISGKISADLKDK